MVIAKRIALEKGFFAMRLALCAVRLVTPTFILPVEDEEILVF